MKCLPVDACTELSRSVAERIMDQEGLYLYHVQKASYFVLERLSQLMSVAPDSLSCLTASIS